MTTTIKITELPAATQLTGTDVLPVVQNNVTKKVDVEELRGYTNILDFGLIADDVNAGPTNNARIQVAVASGKPLYWPKGVYTFTSQIKVGLTNFTCKWKGAGVNDVTIRAGDGFSSQALIYVEASTVDGQPVGKTFDVLFEDIAFDGRGGVSRSPLSGLVYGMYVNWAHFMKINRCSFYGFNGDTSDASVGLYIGAWTGSAPTFNQMITIAESQFTFCSNGIISGGVDQAGNGGGDNNVMTVINTRIGGFTQGSGTIGIHLQNGYTSRIVGTDVETHEVGIKNSSGYNYVSETLAEQNATDLEVTGGFVASEANNFPQIEDLQYQGSIQLGRNGYINFSQVLGAPQNLIIDGTFESSLYTSAFYTGEVRARSSSANYDGAYNRNILYAPGNPSSATRANCVLNPSANVLDGWHTVIVRAKNAVAGQGSALRMFIDSAWYTESIGLLVNGSVVDYLEIGNYIGVAGNHRSGTLTDDWRIYAAFVKFNGSTVANLPIQIQGEAAAVDFVGIFKGMVGYIPSPTTSFDVTVDIAGISPGNTVSIANLNALPTSVGVVIDSISAGATRRIAGLYHTLENSVSAGYSYNTSLNNTWGYSTNSTTSNDHVFINTQCNVLYFQRAAAHPAGSKLSTTIKLLPV